MKTRFSAVIQMVALLLLLSATGLQAQFNYETVNGTIAIAQYTGPGGSVTIPDKINGLPVTTIWDLAFSHCDGLTSVTIPTTVTSIGERPFGWCSNLTAITVDTLNPAYISVDGVLFNKSQTTLVEFPWARAGSYTIPTSVTNIGNYAFSGCSNMTRIYFSGKAPGAGFLFDDTPATVYCLPGTAGWGPTFADRPTALWRPRIEISDGSLAPKTNRFGFNITWASGMTVIVEASPTLDSPVWSPVFTSTFTSGWCDFRDSDSTKYPARFYRVRSP